jgi:hypothetical protein
MEEAKQTRKAIIDLIKKERENAKLEKELAKLTKELNLSKKDK